MSFRFTRVDIPAAGVRSLCWRRDELVDWVSGGAVHRLDGTRMPPVYAYSYRFDSAQMAPSGSFAFLYERLGTKGLLLDAAGRVVREVNRSYYHAHAYEYPVALCTLPDGRDVIVHCPREYCRLEMEQIASGESLTSGRHGRTPKDFFHSRLAVNRAGTRLLSAGWFWSPLDAVNLYELGRALEDPTSLDAVNSGPPTDAEIAAAAFAGDDLLLVASSKEGEGFDSEPEIPVLGVGQIGAFDLVGHRYLSLAPLDQDVGTMMPVGTDHVVGFFGHPKLIEVASGRTVLNWPDLLTGSQSSSIIWHHVDALPPLALDPAKARFAVAGESGITVVQLDRGA